jgi:Tol biopolymer transport system component
MSTTRPPFGILCRLDPWATAALLALTVALLFLLQTGRAAAQAPQPDRCPDAQFVIPTTGKLGWSYNSPNSTNPPPYPNIHTGLDILGDPRDIVVAPYDGVVTRFKKNASVPLAATFHISHTELNIETYYAHMVEVYVTNGQPVHQGDPIGRKGSVGTDTLHLHFSINKPGTDERNIVNTYDPSSYLAAQVNYNVSAIAWGKWTIHDLCYGQQVEPVTVVLIIDSTGSMNQNDPTNLRRQAAKAFIDAAQTGDRIAVVSFDTTANVLAPMRTIQGDADRSTLKAAVDQVDSNGNTDLNAGLNSGFVQLQNDSGAGRKVALILTDGRQESNGPYYDNSHLQYKAKGWAIHTIGLSDNVEGRLLARIAAETGGTYSQLKEAGDLQSKYFEISQLLNKSSMLLQTRQLLANGGSATVAVNVPPQQTKASFFVGWPGSDVQTTLTSPTGRIVSPAQLGTNVQHSKGATYELYTVAYPEAGAWSVDLYGASLASGGEPVDVRVAAVGDKHLYLAALGRDTSFVSAPYQPPAALTEPANPYPSAGELVTDLEELDLTWDDGDALRTFPIYDFYFGTSYPPPLVTQQQGGAIHYVNDLQPGMTYYWQVVSIGARGERKSGPVWTFATASQVPAIAFTSDRSGKNDIYRVQLDGSGLQQLTTDPARDEGPSWSPDGRQIVFHSVRDGYSQLYVMNSDGTNQRRFLTTSTMDEWAYWSPAGDRIAFSRVADHNGDGKIRSEVYMVNADGTNVRRITYSTGISGSNAYGCWPSGWTSSGDKLLLYCYEGNNNLYMVDADGANLVTVLANGTWNSIPTISPDGSKIAFSAYSGNNYEVFVLDRISRQMTQVTNNPGSDWRPIWSPAGDQILFESDRGGETQVYRMSADGSGVQMVPAGAGHNSQATWRP